MDHETTTMNERLGFSHALIFGAVIVFGFCAVLAFAVAVGAVGAWLIITASEAFQAALAGLGGAL